MKIYVKDDVVVSAVKNDHPIEFEVGYDVYIVPDGTALSRSVDGESYSIPMTASEVLASVSGTLYAAERASAYPPISDYIDGVVKGDQAQIDDYIQKCLAVKAKYPKPIQE